MTAAATEYPGTGCERLAVIELHALARDAGDRPGRARPDAAVDVHARADLGRERGRAGSSVGATSMNATSRRYLAEHGMIVENTGLYSFSMFTIGITKAAGTRS